VTRSLGAVRAWLQQNIGLSPAVQMHLLVSVLAIAGLWLLQRIVLAVVYRRATDPWTRYRWRKGTTYAFIVAGILVVGREWLEGFKAVATFLGLVSAGVAIALKDPLTNLAGWAFIVSRRPFDVGDRIEIGGHKGDVIDQRLFQFTLNEIGAWVDADQSTGRIIHIPNGRIFTDPIANYDKGFKYIWNEVPVIVTYESDWKKAKEILTAVAFKHAEHLTAEAERDLLTASRQFFINYRKLTPIVYTSTVDSGVRLTMRYLIEPRRRRGTVSAIWEDILTEFAKCPDIDLAYHTVRSFKSTEEGKQAARPAPGGGRAHRRRDDPPLQDS
jgi:small-conductance mechanosensitive channel